MKLSFHNSRILRIFMFSLFFISTQKLFAPAVTHKFVKDGFFSCSHGTGASIACNASALQTDGKILLAGRDHDGRGMLVRLTAQGDLDTSFNASDNSPGIVLHPGVVFNGVKVQADGKIVVVGQETTTDINGVQRPFIARYQANGIIDPLFGTAGIVNTPFTPVNIGVTTVIDTINAVVIDADKKIVIAGTTSVTTIAGGAVVHKFAVARYQTNGIIDPLFGTAGKTLTAFTNSTMDKANAVAIQPDGKIVVVGQSQGTSSSDFAVARYTTGGVLDTTFNSGAVGSAAGTVRTDIGMNSVDVANAVAVDGDGRIFLTGVSGANLVMVRYNADGIAYTIFSMANGHTGKAIFMDGTKIVIAGTVTDGRAFVGRSIEDGTPDTNANTGFGAISGNLRTGYYYTPNAQFSSLILEPGGKIIAAGINGSAHANPYQFRADHISSDGQLRVGASLGGLNSFESSTEDNLVVGALDTIFPFYSLQHSIFLRRVPGAVIPAVVNFKSQFPVLGTINLDGNTLDLQSDLDFRGNGGIGSLGTIQSTGNIIYSMFLSDTTTKFPKATSLAFSGGTMTNGVAPATPVGKKIHSMDWAFDNQFLFSIHQSLPGTDAGFIRVDQISGPGPTVTNNVLSAGALAPATFASTVLASDLGIFTSIRVRPFMLFVNNTPNYHCAIGRKCSGLTGDLVTTQALLISSYSPSAPTTLSNVPPASNGGLPGKDVLSVAWRKHGPWKTSVEAASGNFAVAGSDDHLAVVVKEIINSVTVYSLQIFKVSPEGTLAASPFINYNLVTLCPSIVTTPPKENSLSWSRDGSKIALAADNQVLVFRIPTIAPTSGTLTIDTNVPPITIAGASRVDWYPHRDLLAVGRDDQNVDYVIVYEYIESNGQPSMVRRSLADSVLDGAGARTFSDFQWSPRGDSLAASFVSSVGNINSGSVISAFNHENYTFTLQQATSYRNASDFAIRWNNLTGDFLAKHDDNGGNNTIKVFNFASSLSSNYALDNVRVVLQSDITLDAALNIVGEQSGPVIIDGGGHTLTFSPSGRFILGSGKRLKFKNIKLRGFSGRDLQSTLANGTVVKGKAMQNIFSNMSFQEPPTLILDNVDLDSEIYPLYFPINLKISLQGTTKLGEKFLLPDQSLSSFVGAQRIEGIYNPSFNQNNLEFRPTGNTVLNGTLFGGDINATAGAMTFSKNQTVFPVQSNIDNRQAITKRFSPAGQSFHGFGVDEVTVSSHGKFIAYITKANGSTPGRLRVDDTSTGDFQKVAEDILSFNALEGDLLDVQWNPNMFQPKQLTRPVAANNVNGQADALAGQSKQLTFIPHYIAVCRRRKSSLSAHVEIYCFYEPNPTLLPGQLVASLGVPFVVRPKRLAADAPLPGQLSPMARLDLSTTTNIYVQLQGVSWNSLGNQLAVSLTNYGSDNTYTTAVNNEVRVYGVKDGIVDTSAANVKILETPLTSTSIPNLKQLRWIQESGLVKQKVAVACSDAVRILEVEQNAARLTNTFPTLSSGVTASTKISEHSTEPYLVVANASGDTSVLSVYQINSSNRTFQKTHSDTDNFIVPVAVNTIKPAADGNAFGVATRGAGFIGVTLNRDLATQIKLITPPMANTALESGLLA